MRDILSVFLLQLLLFDPTILFLNYSIISALYERHPPLRLVTKAAYTHTHAIICIIIIIIFAYIYTYRGKLDLFLSQHEGPVLFDNGPPGDTSLYYIYNNRSKTPLSVDIMCARTWGPVDAYNTQVRGIIRRR